MFMLLDTAQEATYTEPVKQYVEVRLKVGKENKQEESWKVSSYLDLFTT